jgi:hypothetical protein
MRHIWLNWSPRERVLAQQKPGNVWRRLKTSSTIPNRNWRQTADAARKQIARLGMVLALSMLIGAFIDSAAAALGGRIRDEH